MLVVPEAEIVVVEREPYQLETLYSHQCPPAVEGYCSKLSEASRPWDVEAQDIAQGPSLDHNLRRLRHPD